MVKCDNSSKWAYTLKGHYTDTKPGNNAERQRYIEIGGGGITHQCS